jgi:hypothetical protein
LQIKKERKKFHATSRSPQNQKSAEKWEASPVKFHSQSLGILIQQSRQLKKIKSWFFSAYSFSPSNKTGRRKSMMTLLMLH